MYIYMYIYPSITWGVKWEIFVFKDVCKEACPKISVKSNHYRYTYSYLYLPYSGNLSRVKTFVNFAVSGQFAKVLTEKIFIGYHGVIINGRVIVVFTICESFNRKNPTFSNLWKFSPAKDSRYTVYVFIYVLSYSMQWMFCDVFIALHDEEYFTTKRCEPLISMVCCHC